MCSPSHRTGLSTLFTGACLALLCAAILMQSKPLPTRLFEANNHRGVEHSTLFQAMGTRAGVFDTGATSVYSVNGYRSMWIGPHTSDLAEDMLSGVVPAFYSRARDRALVIGSGTGVTPATTARLYRHTWLVDLDPNTPDILRHFADVNDNVISSPDVDLVVSDALSWLASSECKFDAILDLATAAAERGSNQVFTREFMLMARARLRPGGVFTLWLGTIDHAAGMAVLWRTFRTVFPYTKWVHLHAGYVLILGSVQPLQFRHRKLFPLLTITQQRILRSYFDDRRQTNSSIPLAKHVSHRSFDPLMPGTEPDFLAPLVLNTLNTPYLQFRTSISWSVGMGTDPVDIEQSRRWLRLRTPELLRR